MKYIAILRQADGCDYTIGCGINVIEFEAENNIEAAKKLKLIIYENYNNSERSLSSAHYYVVDGKFEVDLNKWYSEFAETDLLNALDQEKEKDLVEFERIRKKYNL